MSSRGGPSTDNRFTITKPVGPDLIAITDNTTANPSAGVTVTADRFSATQVEIQGGAGNDTLTIDEQNGVPDMTNNGQKGSILFDGAGGSNTLIFKSTAAAPRAVVATYNPGPGTGAGSVTHDDGLSTPLTVYFTNLQPVIDTVPGPLIVNANNAANAINYTEGLDATLALNPAFGQVSVDNLESMNFSNKTTLTINTLAGSDEINLNNPNTPTGLTGITVNGQDPTASDTLIANGTPAADAINYAPTAPDAGTITGAGPVPITFTTVEQVSINGQGGGDTLTYTSPANASAGSSMIFTPGATQDAGTITGRKFGGSTLTPLAFSNLGATGNVTFAGTDAGRHDALTFNGTNNSDEFDVNGPGNAGNGTVRLLSNGAATFLSLPVNTNSISVLDLNALAGDDIFNVVGALPYAALTLDGGDPSGSDIAFLSGATGPVAVSIADTTLAPPAISDTTVAGYGGLVILSGVEVANLNTNTFALTATGYSGPNSFTYTPTGADDRHVHRRRRQHDIQLQQHRHIRVHDCRPGEPGRSGHRQRNRQQRLHPRRFAESQRHGRECRRNRPQDGPSRRDDRASCRSMGGLGTDTFYVVPALATATGTGGGATTTAVPINLAHRHRRRPDTEHR